MAWTQNGPVSLPPQNAVYIVAGLIGLVALSGAGMGLRAAWRGGSGPSMADQTSVADDATPARPIVVLPSEMQAAPPAEAASNAAQDASAGDDTNDIAAKSAEAQEVQSKTSKTPTLSPDEILASPSERPTAPSKNAQDEGAPSASDVPF
jgi:hypothetical protein